MATEPGKTDGPGMCQGFQRVQAFHFPALELPQRIVTLLLTQSPWGLERRLGELGLGPAPRTPHQAQTGQPCWG